MTARAQIGRKVALVLYIDSRKARVLRVMGVLGLLAVTLAQAIEPSSAVGTSKPNIIVYFADDISAREFPVYGSSVWSQPTRGDTSDPAHLAKTPVMDELAEEGCWIETAWAACVCNPSRAMMMSGRYAHIHKWWNNKDKGFGPDENGKISTWPVYQS